MNDLITQSQNLPSTLEDLSRFVLVGREKLKAVRAEIRAIDNLNLATEVRAQKLQEAQEISNAVIDAETRIGVLTLQMEVKSGGDRKSEKIKRHSGMTFDSGYMTAEEALAEAEKLKPTTKTERIKELGFNKQQVSEFERMAKNPELVEQAKAEAVTKDEIPTRKSVMDKIKAAEKEKSRGEREEKIAEQIARPKTSNHIDIFTTEKKYRVIYADPPWSYGDKQNIDGLGGAEKHYPTMPLEDICALPIPAEDNAVLFLWVTSPMLEDCFKVINAWGFKYKSSFVWNKVKHNMGHYNSVRHELLLICTKGSCTPDNVKLFDSVVTVERTEHSKKPDVFRNMIDTLYPTGNRLEMFAREASDGWDVWGNMA